MEIERKLRELGYELPTPPPAAGTYVGCVLVDRLLFVSGNIGRVDGKLKYTGKVGDEVTIEQGYEMARGCALNHLAVIKAKLGDLDRIERVVKVNGFVNGAPGFTQGPQVLNGASDLWVALLGERGEHARTTVGVAALAQNAPVEVEVVVQVKE